MPDTPKKIDKYIHVAPGAKIMEQWARFRERAQIKHALLIALALQEFMASHKNMRGPADLYGYKKEA